MFSFLLVLQIFMLVAAILGARLFMYAVPNRVELGVRVSSLIYERAMLDGSAFGPFGLSGAWTVTSSDPRFGAFSGLELDGGKLLAIGDSGAVAWLDLPGGKDPRVRMKDLPAGPGNGRFKFNRDAEAIRRDRSGRGWWVPFERVNQLWLYDHSFSNALGRVRFGTSRWPHNAGIEGLVTDRDNLLLFVEGDSTIFRAGSQGLTGLPLVGKTWAFSEAIRLPDGRLVAIERTLGWSGFRNALVFLGRDRAGYRVRLRVELPLGPLDNMEGMAAETLPDGKTRLWIIADDNFERPMRTLLLALDLPPESKQP